MRCSVFIASSLDNFIATVDDRLDWLEAAGLPGEDYGYDRFIADIDVVAMGRGTYDYIAEIDPLPYGERPLYVFTHRTPPPRPGVTFVDWSPEEAVAKWDAAGHRHAYVDGGRLISQFLAAGLIGEMLFTKVPILLGAGRPLFHPSARTTALELVGVEAFPSGMVNLAYRSISEDPA